MKPVKVDLTIIEQCEPDSCYYLIDRIAARDDTGQ